MSHLDNKSRSYSLRYVAAVLAPFLMVFIALFILAGHLIGDIDFTKKELDGLHDIHILQEVFLDFQQLRPGAGDRTEELKKKVKTALEELQTDEHSLSFKTVPLIKNIIQRVEAFFNLANQEDIAGEYSGIIRDIKALKLLIANRSKVILDDEIDSYHIIRLLTEKIPDLIDTAGKIEGLTERFLDGEVAHMFLHSEMDALNRILTQMKMSEEAVIQSKPAFKATDYSLDKTLLAKGRQYLLLIDNLLHNSNAAATSKEIAGMKSLLVEECMHYYRQAAGSLDSLLKERIYRFNLLLAGSLVVFLISAALATYFITGFYRSNRLLSAMNAGLDEANALLKESERKFKAIFDMAVDGILVADAETKRFIMSNDKFRDMTGYSYEELEGMTVTDIHPKENLPWVMEQFQMQLRREIQVAENIPVKRKDGNLFYADINSAPFMMAGRNCLMGIFRDITNRKNAEKALFEAHQESVSIMEDLYYEIEERKLVESQLRKLTVAVEQNPASIIITCLEGKIEYVNPHFTKTTGYSVKEAIGQNPNIVKSGNQPDAFYKELWETITNGRTWTGDFQNKKKNGELYWDSASISPIRDESGKITHFIAIETDITDRRAQEEKIRRQQLEEEILNRILALSIEELAFDALIGRCLDELLAIPFIHIKSKGSIFTVDEDKNTLTMAVQRGLSESVLKQCSRLPFGRCLCGRAAETGKTEFANSIDDRHDIRYDGMQPHGHYCIPIKTPKEVLGVINLYLEEGCSRDEKAISLLESIAATMAGIMERKRIQDRLKESEEKFRLLFDSSSDAMMLLNEKSFLKCNDATLKMFDCGSEEEFCSKHLSDISPPKQVDGKSSRQAADERIATAFREGRNFFEWTHRRLNGEDFPAEVLLTAMKIDGKDVLQATVRDITRRKIMETQLKESEKKYRDIITTSREGYWLLDKDRRIIDINESLSLMLGYSREELIGKCPIDFTDEKNAEIFKFQSSKISSTLHRVYEIMLKNKNGEDIPAIIHGTTIKGREGNASGSFAFITDVSELKKTEASLRRAKEEAEEATNLKDKFVSLVSHDLKGPINLIVNYFDLIRATEPLSNQGKEMIGEGIESCDEMVALINEVLKLSRIKGGKIMPAYSFVHVHRVAAQAIHNYQRIAKDKEIEIVCAIPEKTKIYADDKLLLEVFRNLVSNAVKFCKKGDRIKFYVPDGEPSTIAVADTGLGINKSRLDTLFRYEVKTSTRGTSGESGTGLGLPLCRDIIAAHGGNLEVESEIEKGSTFYIRLPHIKPTVIIVDDDESVRVLCKKWLEKLDVTVMEAGDGEEALETMRESRPHLFFVDLHMPGMGGLELLSQIKKDPENGKAPVIVITADKALEVVDQAFLQGAADFIVKPFGKGELIERVEKFLE